MRANRRRIRPMMPPNTFTLLCALAVIGVVFIICYPLKGIILTTKEDITKKLSDLVEQAHLAHVAIADSVQSLKDQLNQENVSSPDLDDKLARLDTSVGALDSLKPDPPTADHV